MMHDIKHPVGTLKKLTRLCCTSAHSISTDLGAQLIFFVRLAGVSVVWCHHQKTVWRDFWKFGTDIFQNFWRQNSILVNRKRSWRGMCQGKDFKCANIRHFYWLFRLFFYDKNTKYIFASAKAVKCLGKDMDLILDL